MGAEKRHVRIAGFWCFVRFRVEGGIVRLRATSLLPLPVGEILGKKSRG